MEHIKQYDWCSTLPDRHFITEQEMDNSVTERILRNTFRDPTLSSDSEDERNKPVFDWDDIFKRKPQQERQHRVFVPGLRPLPPYPKLSSLNGLQHYQCLKVMCYSHPTILEKEFIPRPTKQDHKKFEELKDLYAKEQQEYKEWAKVLWTNVHCSRSLRPKPTIETVYEAEFNIKANRMQSFPKTYKLAAQIPLEIPNNHCEMIFQKNLKKVNIKDLPQSNFPVHIQKKITIMRPGPILKPCNKHPTGFILPNEQSVTMLPLTEVHRELSQWALDSGVRFVASENALKCLVEIDRCWMIPVSVCEAISPDGDKSNVVILGSQFATYREPAMVRTYKAFRHLLEFALVPPMERMKLELKQQEKEQQSLEKSKIQSPSSKKEAKTRESGRNKQINVDRMSISSDEDENHLFIDVRASESENLPSSETETNEIQPDNLNIKYISQPNNENTEKDKSTDEIGHYNCTCKERKRCKSKYAISFGRNNTDVTIPPPRSYRKWLVKNNTSKEQHTIIIHCSHKIKGEEGELVLEPIPEYQLELGGMQQSPAKIASSALSLALRKNASLLNVRIDSCTGDIVTIDNIHKDEYTRIHGDLTSIAANRLHSLLNQLEGLMPGHYVLQHDSLHGTNALLYAPSPPERAELTLEFNSAQLLETDEAKSIRTPPTLGPVLLPFHKFRKILPLSFTPHSHQLAKEPKKPITRQKTPPQAIKEQSRGRKWPKKKHKKKKNTD
ncbi:uncharacterized protein LOC128669244 isoform X2 [Plodia interpunctella]|uniref:uncharacterized protein LOC128669244 isoform X2 n=1 Tax=Plodia interpunctella TaxID=58824 RepID=UPI0023682138|nr:uncharacterized protein LOC128669244 isoform X2 [Plodia interpunctella]